MFGPSFGQQSSYNYFPNNGDNTYNRNAWDNSQQVNGGASRRGYDDYNRGNDKQRSYGNDGIKVSFITIFFVQITPTRLYSFPYQFHVRAHE